MKTGPNSSNPPAEHVRRSQRTLHFGCALTVLIVFVSLMASLVLPKGFQLALLGDLLRTGLVGAITFLSIQNALRSKGQVRAFWFLLFVGAAMWLAGLAIWSTQELWFRHQAAVNSLRNSLRNPDSRHPTPMLERGDS